MSAPRPSFVFVATGARYWREAAAAAAQLRRVHPDARIGVVGDPPAVAPFWDDYVALPAPTYTYRDKLAMGLCPYDRFIFLDTDVHVVLPLDDVFRLLDRFDFAAHQLFEGHNYLLPDVPDAFPEIQAGLIAIVRSPRTEAFLADWLARYDAYRAPDNPERDDYVNVSDQKSLRAALYHSGLRFAILGPEYNFTPAHVNFACARVRLLHGRGDPFAPFAERLNAKLGNRVYHPTLDVVLHAEILPAELRRLWWRATLQLLRQAGAAVLPRRLLDRLRRSRFVRRLLFGHRFAP